MDIKKYTTNIPESFLQFTEQVKNNTVVQLHSMYVVGSVLTPDFKPDSSDINSIIIVKEHELAFLDFLIKQGRKFKDHGVAPPLVMTVDYIEQSLDVFPIEFFNFRAIHHLLFGRDILSGLQVADHHLRLQCEREIKAKLLWLGQIYIETLGEPTQLSEKLAASISGYFPLFRAILHLAGRDVPLGCREVIMALHETVGLDTDIFTTMFRLKTTTEQLMDKDELCSCFTQYYQATAQVVRYVDQLSA